MDQPKHDDITRTGAGIARSGAGRAGFVTVRGAREHNLRDVNVEMPRDALVVFTGVSGSGKSSLAFGTLYAEAQRRYFESVAPYARRMIDQVGVPDVDAIEGLPPAVALQQQRGTPSARSSVGSVTTLSSLVRMMYSRAGTYPPGQPMLFAEDFSPNTPQGACPSCGGLGRVYSATEASMVPDPSLTIRERAVAAWPQAWGGQNLRDILVSRGVDVDTPWRDLPRALRDWILFTDEQPQEPVYAGLTPEQTRAARRRGLEPSYTGTFTSARRHVMHAFTHSQSALMRRRAASYLVSEDCAACHGKRLKPEALSVTFAGLDIGDLSRMPLSDLAEAWRRPSRTSGPRTTARRTPSTARRAGGTGPRGSPPAGRPMRPRPTCGRRRISRSRSGSPPAAWPPTSSTGSARSRISASATSPRPRHHDPVLGRAAAPAARHPAALAALRRGLRPRRADRGPASRRRRRDARGARRIAGSGQLALRRRARHRDDAPGRLARRCRSRRGRAWRYDSLQRPAGGPARGRGVAHPPAPVRPRRAARPAPARGERVAAPRRHHPQQPARGPPPSPSAASRR